MKKRLLVALLVVSMLILTGCAVKMEVGLNVKKDGKVSMTVISAYDNDFIDKSLAFGENNGAEGATANKTYSDEERWKYIEDSDNDESGDFKDYKKEKYEEGEFKGYKYTRELGTLEDITEENASGSVSYEELTQKNKFFTKKDNVYTLHIDMNKDSGELADAEDYVQQGLNLKMDFVVTLPEKAKSHNATTVSRDGLTYTWDLLKVKTVDLSFEEFSSGGGIMPFIIIAGVIIAIIVITSKKKNSANVEQNPMDGQMF